MDSFQTDSFEASGSGDSFRADSFEADKPSKLKALATVLPMVGKEVIGGAHEKANVPFKAVNKFVSETAPSFIAEHGYPLTATAVGTLGEAVVPSSIEQVAAMAVAGPALGKLGEAYAPLVENVTDAFPKVGEFLQKDITPIITKGMDKFFPHQMSKEQYRKVVVNSLEKEHPTLKADSVIHDAIDANHQEHIVDAMKNGHSIPESVRAQYPHLKSELIPGTKEFIEKDVKEAVGKIVGGLKGVGEFTQKLFAPATRGDSAKATAGIIRENASDLARQKDIAEEFFSKAEKAMDALPKEEKFNFIHTIESGGEQPTPEFRALHKDLSGILEQDRKDVLKTGKTVGFIEDYFPHIWKKPNEAEQAFGKVYGKRPLGGSGAFRKQRVIPTIKDGLELGLEPVTDNPVRLALLKHYEMRRFIHGQNIIEEMKDNGLAKFVRSGRSAPEGWIPINDKIARVMQYSAKEKGLIQRGSYYAPEHAGTVINNYLSPGLKGNILFDTVRALGNVLNQVQLGLSAFHLSFTSNDAIVSRGALMLEQSSRGEIGKVVTSVAKGEIISAPVQSYLTGSKLLGEWLKPGSQGEEMGAVLEALKAGGGRVKMDQFYKNSSVESFWNALHGGNLPKAAILSPFALTEWGASGIMEDVVPKQKLGTFFYMAKEELEHLASPGESLMQTVQKVPRQQLRDVMGRAWDSVDNRLGQMVYDNLFWHRTLKDTMMVSVRSLGWNLGTFRELGGGAYDTAKMALRLASGKSIEMTPRMAYSFTLPAVVAAEGAMYQYLHTGEGPKELKDYFFPRTGKTRPDGTPERVSLPSYVKDVAAFSMRPGQTLMHKAHPELAMVYDMIKNEDFFGVKIRNEEDPIVTQMKDEAEYVAKQFIPFSFRNLMERKKAGASIGAQAESFFGIVPAAGYITKSPAQQAMEKTMGERARGVRTKDQFEKSQLIKGFVERIRKGENVTDDVDAAQNAGQIDQRDVDHIWSGEETTPNQDKFKKLPLEDAARIFQLMTPQEKAEVKEVFGDQIDRASGDMTPEKEDEYYSILDKK